jgi:hypothetical protein
VTPHQDGSFLYNTPGSLYGFWFPLDEATLENGCLWSGFPLVLFSHGFPLNCEYLREFLEKFGMHGIKGKRDHQGPGDDS